MLDLIKEAITDNPRLIEPLFLYCLVTDKLALLLKSAKPYLSKTDYIAVLELLQKRDIVDLLTDKESPLPVGYQKVYRSYLVKKNKQKNANHTKELIRNRVRMIQHEKGVST